MPIFQSILVLNRLSKGISFAEKWKNAVFIKFLFISKWNWQKRTNSNLLLWILASSWDKPT